MVQRIHLHALLRQQRAVPGRALLVPAREVAHGGDELRIGVRFRQVGRGVGAKALHAVGGGSALGGRKSLGLSNSAPSGDKRAILSEARGDVKNETAQPTVHGQTTGAAVMWRQCSAPPAAQACPRPVQRPVYSCADTRPASMARRSSRPMARPGPVGCLQECRTRARQTARHATGRWCCRCSAPRGGRWPRFSARPSGLRPKSPCGWCAGLGTSHRWARSVLALKAWAAARSK